MVGERSIVGPDWANHDKVHEIRQNLMIARSRQKSYAGVRRRALEFEVGYEMFLKVSLMKGIVRFGTKREA